MTSTEEIICCDAGGKQKGYGQDMSYVKTVAGKKDVMYQLDNVGTVYHLAM
jgi:hypothetical protein